MRTIFISVFIFLLLASAAYFGYYKGETPVAFQLVDPEQAPHTLYLSVMNGYRQMLQTKALLPDYVGNHLNCSNCHFGGGNNTGGTGNGIPLAGVAAQYPRYNPRTNKVETLEARINDCFLNSMNGKALPMESEEMVAFVSYLHWISSGFPIYAPAHWLGVLPLKTMYKGEEQKGAKLYAAICADCHGDKGEGKSSLPKQPALSVPPLWGNQSFNSEAGMNKPEILSSFIFHNMPFDSPGLSVEEAVDIAAFILKQERPNRR